MKNISVKLKMSDILYPITLFDFNFGIYLISKHCQPIIGS